MSVTLTTVLMSISVQIFISGLSLIKLYIIWQVSRTPFPVVSNHICPSLVIKFDLECDSKINVHDFLLLEIIYWSLLHTVTDPKIEKLL